MKDDLAILGDFLDKIETRSKNAQKSSYIKKIKNIFDANIIKNEDIFDRSQRPILPINCKLPVRRLHHATTSIFEVKQSSSPKRPKKSKSRNLMPSSQEPISQLESSPQKNKQTIIIDKSTAESMEESSLENLEINLFEGQIPHANKSKENPNFDFEALSRPDGSKILGLNIFIKIMK